MIFIGLNNDCLYLGNKFFIFRQRFLMLIWVLILDCSNNQEILCNDSWIIGNGFVRFCRNNIYPTSREAK